MKLYLAAPFQCQEEVKTKAVELESLGAEVTSRWRFEDDVPTGKIGDAANQVYYAEKAFIDLDDIDAADTLVLLTDQISQTGGKHTEFGYALGRGLKLYVIGGVENIFHWLPRAERVSWEEFKAIVKEKVNAKQRSTSTFAT